MAIFHRDIVFILEPEIPDPAVPFLDDINIKGPETCFETEDGDAQQCSAATRLTKYSLRYYCS